MHRLLEQGLHLKSSSRQWLRRDFSFWLYLSLQMQMMGSLAPFNVCMRSATPPLSPADMPSTSSMIRHICITATSEHIIVTDSSTIPQHLNRPH